MGVLVRFLPYWYLFVSSLCLFVLGSTLYAVSYMSWLLIISELLIGFFRGAAMTLSYSYAVDSSNTYSELQQQRSGYKPIIEISNAKKSAKIRDLLFAIEGVGRGVGFIIGPSMFTMDVCVFYRRTVHMYIYTCCAYVYTCFHEQSFAVTRSMV